MRLTRLQLSGFKSFADTVELVINDGVTAVVGPNGCGKSNISDAVRWVLGEQRARILRGARMEEVIFQGSSKRRAINIAEVSLHFDNSAGTLPVAYSEVVVTRRLSRSGQSEYLLNQNPARLRDVQDLLRGTGMGSDAGVVIEAGMIERLLSERAEERRALFEEAAGIGFYRDRKDSTQRRLEKTGEDLQRLDDVISEVQTQVRSLARQRGRAERHKKLMDDRFEVVMTLARRELALADAQAAALQARRAELQVTIPQARDAVADRERDREARVQDRATAEVRRVEVERRLSATRVEVERLEGDLNLAAERFRNAAARRTRAQEERAQADARAAQAQRERDAARAEGQAAEAARKSVQTELDLRAASEEQARTGLAGQREQVRELESGLQKLVEQLAALDAERAAAEREAEDLAPQVGRAHVRRAELEREGRSTRQQVEAMRTQVAEREREEQEATAALERARSALAAAREAEATIRIQRRNAEEPLAQLGARRGALEKLERERVGLAPAARQLLDAREQFGEGAVLGPLSDFVQVTAHGAQLAERLLGDWLHAMLVRDADVIPRIREWHRGAQPGPLVLLPVAPGPVQRGAPAQAAPISALAPADAWVRELVRDHEVIDDGAVRRANGAVFLPGAGESSGPLTRRAELDALRGDIATAEALVADLERRAGEAARAHTEAEQTLRTVDARAEHTRIQHREVLTAYDDALRVSQRVERERSEGEETRARLVSRSEALAARLKQIASDLSEGRVERERIEAGLATQRAGLGDLEAAQEAARERRVHWQVEEAQVSAREQGARERETRAEEAWAAARAEIEALDTETGTLNREVEELERTRAQWTDALAERRVGAQQLEAAATAGEEGLHRGQEALAAAETALEQARTRFHSLGEESHRLELQEAEALGSRRILLERMEAEWQKPAADLLAATPDVEGEGDHLREEAERLAKEIEGIGPVNALAVDEHAEEVKRALFLTTQREDLVSARASLQQAVLEIDQTAKGMFVETFTSIRTHFHSVFRTLFDGGECDVRLLDESDPLGSEIEIHAAPRGKRTQRIHLLSSGERALVAISLLFSIYLTKPSPFCVLDEVDAPLDDANVSRFVRLLDEFKTGTQFIVITHNPRTMQVADAVYGVTMQEPGVSSIVGVRLGEVETV
ncbi:MAG: hypothetical protein EXR93_01645 [Gemmatimonadetes bacterium]|nr:hypothetical protein [Gemmatimonadota bacterium]